MWNGPGTIPHGVNEGGLWPAALCGNTMPSHPYGTLQQLPPDSCHRTDLPLHIQFLQERGLRQDPSKKSKECFVKV